MSLPCPFSNVSCLLRHPGLSYRTHFHRCVGTTKKPHGAMHFMYEESIFASYVDKYCRVNLGKFAVRIADCSITLVSEDIHCGQCSLCRARLKHKRCGIQFVYVSVRTSLPNNSNRMLGNHACGFSRFFCLKFGEGFQNFSDCLSKNIS